MTDDDIDDEDDSLPLRELERLRGGACQKCRRRYTDHEAIFSIALGFKNAPRCLPCLAQGLNRDPGELRDQLIDYVQKRECFRRAWCVADENAASPPQEAASCPMPTEPAEPTPEAGSFHDEWDAGAMGCGDLVLALRIRMNKMPPGSVLKVIAHDPAAPQDLPAWCRMTGHTLIESTHPNYRIRRREG